MNTALNRIELSRLAGVGGSFSMWTGTAALKSFNVAFVWLPAVLIAGLGAWMLASGYSSDPAESEPVQLATAVTSELAPSSAAGTAQPESWFNPAVAPVEGNTPAQMAPIDGLKIASQSWRRGGLGSKALVTLTLRNSNDYAVKDIEIFCTFTRRDGSHLTDRKRVIPDAVNMKSRKTFARMHVGFVNVNASQAKCALVSASRI